VSRHGWRCGWSQAPSRREDSPVGRGGFLS
jgi:hypothetical protein